MHLRRAQSGQAMVEFAIIGAVVLILSLGTLQVARVHDHVPLPVWICLWAVTALGMLTMGYQSSLVGSKRAWAMFPLIIAFCVMLCLAVDLDRPQQGVLRVDQSPMMRLADSLEKG